MGRWLALPVFAVRVRVVNGSGIPGLGARALAQLVAGGFRAAGPAVDADRSTYARTEVRWGAYKDVEGVTAAYATGARVSGQAAKPTDTGSADVLIVVGKDWDALPHHFAVPARSPAHRAVTSTSSTPAHRTATTATTAAPRPRGADVRFAPVDPKTRGVLVGCPA